MLSPGTDCAEVVILSILDENSCRSRAELVTAIEAGDFKDEQIAHNLALELSYEVSCCLGRAA